MLLTDIDGDAARSRRAAFNERVRGVGDVHGARCSGGVRFYDFRIDGAFAFAWIENGSETAIVRNFLIQFVARK